MVIFVDELDKLRQKPIDKRTRAHKLPVNKVLANMTQINKKSLNLTGIFKKCLLAVPAVIYFIINAAVSIEPPEKSLNGLQLSNITPELGEQETLRMTDTVCNMKKDGFDSLKYIQYS